MGRGVIDLLRLSPWTGFGVWGVLKNNLVHIHRGGLSANGVYDSYDLSLKRLLYDQWNYCLSGGDLMQYLSNDLKALLLSMPSCQ